MAYYFIVEDGEAYDSEADYSIFFHGAVPARAIFETHTHALEKTISAFTNHSLADVRYRQLLELSCIGLASYFEAFCTDHFASIVNICPEILHGYIEKRGEVTVKLRKLLKISSSIRFRLGSLLTEEMDFGSGKRINGLYNDLLGISPFSVNECRKYDAFLEARNLLVHHGGIYNLKYRGEHSDPLRSEVFMDSLIVDRDMYDGWNSFLIGMAKKMAFASQKSLRAIIQEKDLDLPEGATTAIDALIWP